jgi:hypothetical protein
VYDDRVAASERISELRLPITAVAVRLALVGGAPAAAEMFVASGARRSPGQLLDDLAAQLAGGARFLPVRWSQRVRLLGTHAIAWVAVALPTDEPVAGDPAEPDEELTLYDREHRVEIELAHGTKLIGTMLDSSPADRPRVIDHLNQAGPFLRLWTTDEHYLINTTQVVAVTELDEAR